MIAIGSDADLVLVDLKQRVKMEHRKRHSSTDYNVYEGWKVTGWPVATWIRGKQVAADSQITAKPGLGRWLNADVAP